MQVADLDDEFAELLLGEYGDNFDSMPAGKVRYHMYTSLSIFVCVGMFISSYFSTSWKIME